MVTTVQTLSEMTDQALFERLATAVLRDAKAEYGSLLHCGINIEGKTVKSPLDGIGFVQDAKGTSEAHLLASHHTICKRSDLRKKWLHKPTNRKVKKYTVPEGDVIKTCDVVGRERERNPSIRATLVLTTNQEPPEDLVRDVHAAGRASGIVVDVWSVSRIAAHLDHTASGQWLRRELLNVEAQRLSAPLLKKLSNDSLRLHMPDDNPSLWVSRQLDRVVADATRQQDVTFIVAGSGSGKTVACFKHLAAYVQGGGFGLILSHNAVASSLSPQQAIGQALRQLHPEIAVGSERDVFTICTESNPFMLVIEDVNKSGQAQYLTERLIDWGRHSRLSSDTTATETKARTAWRILCPLWPQVVLSLGDEARKRLQTLARYGGALTADEGREAVLRRMTWRRPPVSDLDAVALSEALGHDPLLIALCEPGFERRPERIVEQFIEASLSRLAQASPHCTAGECLIALRALASLMLVNRNLSPEWSCVLKWTARDTLTQNVLRRLTHQAEIIRISGPVRNERLVFRHDRIRDALLSSAIAASLQNSCLDNEILSEPFYAELIGSSLLSEGMPIDVVQKIRAANPLALFHALRIFGEPTKEIELSITSALDDWLDAAETHSRAHCYLRWQALSALSATDSSKVVQLVHKFRDTSMIGSIALFRNGHVSGGIRLCLNLEPGVIAPLDELQIKHAQVRYGDNLNRVVDNILRRTKLDPGTRTGILRLAGHLADPSLAEAIEASWQNDTSASARLGDYLWASARCCANDPPRFLAPICDAWASLTNERIGTSASPRDSLASDNIRWAFRREAPVAAVGYFVRRAQADDLKWPILYMLHTVNDPDALEFVVREIAAHERLLEGSGSFSPFAISAVHEWERGERQAPMSAESRARLLGLWQNRENEEHLRSQALRFWAAGEDIADLETLRLIGADDKVLADKALWQRLKRGDRTAISALLIKLHPDHSGRANWWYLAAQIWCPELRAALLAEFEHRRNVVSRSWNATFATDYQTSQVLMEIRLADAEAILETHWDHLRFSALFVQAALYLGQPASCLLANKAVEDCPDREKLFEHLHMHYGIRVVGRRGVNRPAQIEVLKPYFDYMSDSTVHSLWQVCNENGWFQIRRNLLDKHLNPQFGRSYLDKGQLIARLDAMAKSHSRFIDFAVDEWLKTGVDLDHIMNFLGTWLSDRRSVEAMEVVSAALIHAGARRHLRILNISLEPETKSDAIRSDTNFAVKRRSLN